MFFGGRYIILLMGLFSVYSGLMYNDIFSISIDIFGTSWKPNNVTYDINTDLAQIDSFTLNPNTIMPGEPNQPGDYTGRPYPFGMDPVWQLAENSITWLNSFKMKMSVIMGVSQMFLGLCLSLSNALYFRNYVNIFCEFIPQVIFISCIFGYMNIMIFYKWIVYSAENSSCAPTILVDMIDMFLLQYPSSPCYAETFWPSLGSKVQRKVQSLLIVIALLCVPWILIPKPFILRAKHMAKLRASGVTETKVSSLNGHTNQAFDASTQGTFTRIDLDQPTPVLVQVSISAGGSTTGQTVEMKSMGAKEKEALAQEGLTHDQVNIQVDETAAGQARQQAEMAALEADLIRSKKSRPDEFEDEKFEFGEVFVHQAIHTIEYCLGCISHTASYLRLWALSLAHAELAEVLWVMVLHFGFIVKGYLGIASQFLLFPVWAVLTIAILLMMEGLSAFLHTLRLHWVEFQSKFYGGTGHKFRPFRLQKIIRNMWPEYSDAF
jgi:V-type H+-transporting ATPase subunit a